MRNSAVVASILEEGAEATWETLREIPAGCDLVEIRADRLRRGDVEGIARRTPRPLLVTVRAGRDGGRFDGSEEERRGILEAALAAGAAFVDVEWSGPLADLARGPLASRVVLSSHGGPCEFGTLARRFRAMSAEPASRLKIVPRASDPREAVAIRDLLDLAGRERRPLACFATGDPGLPTRILSPSWGAWGTYGSAGRGRETAEGQLPVQDLLGLYRVLSIGPDTRRFGLVGARVAGSPSPAMHAAAHAESGIDACFLPIESEMVEQVLESTVDGAPIEAEALAVTMPLKEGLAAIADLDDEVAQVAGAVNTLLKRSPRPIGRNTDGPAALDLIEEKLDPKGARVTILGAGGTAKAIGAALRRAGSTLTFVSRDRSRAERAAETVGGAVEPWDRRHRSSWDIFVQATPLGRDGEEVVPPTSLTGRLVLDVVYGRDATPLVTAARRRGLLTVDGFDLLVRQAVRQYEIMTGLKADPRTMAAAGTQWLAAARS